jgi:hypothetical protein
MVASHFSFRPELRELGPLQGFVLELRQRPHAIFNRSLEHACTFLANDQGLPLTGAKGMADSRWNHQGPKLILVSHAFAKNVMFGLTLNVWGVLASSISPTEPLSWNSFLLPSRSLISHHGVP